MPDLQKYIPIHSDDFDISKLQDAVQAYIRSLEAKIKELEARLTAGGL